MAAVNLTLPTPFGDTLYRKVMRQPESVPDLPKLEPISLSYDTNSNLSLFQLIAMKGASH